MGAVSDERELMPDRGSSHWVDSRPPLFDLSSTSAGVPVSALSERRELAGPGVPVGARRQGGAWLWPACVCAGAGAGFRCAVGGEDDAEFAASAGAAF
jgi:hypothetical protein